MKREIVMGFLVSVITSACVVGVRPAPGVTVVVHGPPVEYGYEPVLYDGYVVYFTDDGMPYYWAGGVQVWIPEHQRGYYVSHWRSHRNAYREWYRHRGHEYRNRRYEAAHEKRTLKKVEKRQEAPRLKKVDDDKPRLKKADDFQYDEEGRIINED